MKSKRITWFMLSLLLGAATTKAQTDSTQKAQRFVFHGFVNPHYYADSRSVVGGREEMMLFYPKPTLLDTEGNDINDGWQADMLSITARMGLRINGNPVLGARSWAYIEGDFTGATNANINTLRLRHAYINLDWNRHQILAGQYWYPMMVHEIMPMTNPLNMGAPFNLYARYNQLRYTGIERVGEGKVRWMAAASWQLDNMSQGELDGQYVSSTTFARRSLLPEMTAQLRYESHHWLAGGAINLRTIQPQVPQTILDDKFHSSLTYSLFGRYTNKYIIVRAQALLNNSLYEGCSLGGYYFVTNLVSGQTKCEDWYFNTYWIDIEGAVKKWHPGIFIGYAHNQDWTMTADQTIVHIFGRGADIDKLWRVQPRITYNVSSSFFCTAEAEYTHATYVIAGGQSDKVHNLRLSFSATYAF